MGRSATACSLLSFFVFTTASWASGNRPPERLDQPTPFQAECARAARETPPTRVVFGFDGLGAYDGAGHESLRTRDTPPDPAGPIPDSGKGHLLWGMIAYGVLQAPGPKSWYYFDQKAINGKKLSDAFRCAYEWARARFGGKSGDDQRHQVVLVGFSYGGHAAAQLADQLAEHGQTIDLIVTTDPRNRPFTPSMRKNAHTLHWANFIQKNSIGLNGYKVAGVDYERELSHLGYHHSDMPRTAEVRGYLIEAFDQLLR